MTSAVQAEVATWMPLLGAFLFQLKMSTKGTETLSNEELGIKSNFYFCSNSGSLREWGEVCVCVCFDNRDL